MRLATPRAKGMILANGAGEMANGIASAFDSIFQKWPQSACEMHMKCPCFSISLLKFRAPYNIPVHMMCCIFHFTVVLHDFPHVTTTALGGRKLGPSEILRRWLSAKHLTTSKGIDTQEDLLGLLIDAASSFDCKLVCKISQAHW